MYTTARGTDLKISKTDELQLKPFGQPFETQPCVFVDPTHTFQTFVGIGGAITDAAAETYAKLPDAAKQEFLRAYFSTDQGIGYNLLRTNINSCDFFERLVRLCEGRRQVTGVFQH